MSRGERGGVESAVSQSRETINHVRSVNGEQLAIGSQLAIRRDARVCVCVCVDVCVCVCVCVCVFT